MTTEGAKAFEEAAFFLETYDSMPPLKYSPGLTHAAHDLLLDIQKKEDLDSMNEMNTDSYLDKYGQLVGHFAQAVADFGSSFPELVIVNLLVDDGDSNRDNRDNIINPKFKLVGVSRGSHPIYHRCTVVMYARHFFPPNEVPEELSDEEPEPQKKELKASSNQCQPLNVVRRSSLNILPGNLEKVTIATVDDVEKKVEKLTIAEPEKEEDDFNLPEGVKKMIIRENLSKCAQILKLENYCYIQDNDTKHFSAKTKAFSRIKTYIF